ncbi:MAG TPA: plastocyanin/azurin family copper-binding protein [Acidimicrobiales bacterium]|nr:plastocyanin/azurin family copper-binding protein [Acidimicrobiales bacterium]
MKKLLAPLLALSLVTTAAACGGGDDEPSADAEPGVVLVKDNKFEPKEIEVAVGDTVTWRWEGSAAHNVTGPGFASELISEGEFEHTFEEAGEVDYVCTVHPGMTGTVVVE